MPVPHCTTSISRHQTTCPICGCTNAIFWIDLHNTKSQGITCPLQDKPWHQKAETSRKKILRLEKLIIEVQSLSQDPAEPLPELNETISVLQNRLASLKAKDAQLLAKAFRLASPLLETRKKDKKR